jgi:phenylpropionate dioxygenase-like ring-hydroxylating dioxygenase large terminal subunit
MGLARGDGLRRPDLISSLFSYNIDPEWTVIGNTSNVRGNYQLLSDNLLDLTHETFVHKDSLGDASIPEFPITVVEEEGDIVVTRWILDQPPAPFSRAALGRGGIRCDRWQIIRFAPPANLILEVGVAPVEDNARENGRSGGAEGFNSHAITPETETTSWYFWTFGRKFRRDDEVLTGRLKEATSAIIAEDVHAIEAVQACMGREPNRSMLDIRVDSGALRARRMVKRLLEQEGAGSLAGSQH